MKSVSFIAQRRAGSQSITNRSPIKSRETLDNLIKMRSQYRRKKRSGVVQTWVRVSRARVPRRRSHVHFDFGRSADVILFHGVPVAELGLSAPIQSVHRVLGLAVRCGERCSPLASAALRRGPPNFLSVLRNRRGRGGLEPLVPQSVVWTEPLFGVPPTEENKKRRELASKIGNEFPTEDCVVGGESGLRKSYIHGSIYIYST